MVSRGIRVMLGAMLCLVAAQGSAEVVQGRYATIAPDGAMGEWQAGDLFYDDPEIEDGLPPNSTYSGVYLANDAAYLYIGLQLKAPSSIFSNWTHSLYIDTDDNPATGFNSGWMSGGYDRLVQYGSGGTVYSIYEFTGGGAQGSWAWGFLGTFQYGFNADIIEWALPRSALGGATEPRILFQTGGGDVTIDTWASFSEGAAKNYKFASVPSVTLQVVSGRGSPTPPVGTHTNDLGSLVSASVISPAPASGTQFVNVGWTMTGNDPLSGAGTNFSMTVTNNAVLTWLWATNVQLGVATNGAGSVAGDAAGYYAQDTVVTLTAIPEAGYLFKGWSGGVPPAQTNDNPLLLTLDKARTATANFDLFKGQFGIKALDGSLVEWTTSELFYDDPDIIDGAPAGSTYSAIYVANDHQYLYVGLQLKAPSSINADWTHELFLDTDMNPATGYNSGWMANGYDRLAQYGSGGSVYSIYSFSGGNQSAWAWDYLGAISYAFNDDVIEWAIPRSALGGSTRAKLTFLTEGGSVSVLTWAYHTESQSRIYDFAPSPQYTVTVASARGVATPPVGKHVYEIGTVLTNSVNSPAPANGTQYVGLGWTMTGNEPQTGVGANFEMTVTNNATLTWLWATNVQLALTTNGPGSIAGDAPDYYARGAVVNLTATPAAGYLFAGWSGDVPPAQAGDNPLALTMDQRRNVTANFAPHEGTYLGAFTLDGSFSDWAGVDAFYTDAEIADGAPLSSTFSAIYVANGVNDLYIGLQYKAPSSILSNWVVDIYLDSDLNPATGFNAGWMANGYDRLIRFGSSGGNYSVFHFTGATQDDWGWAFDGLMDYASDGNTTELRIPLSLLNLPGNQFKLEVHVAEGDVTQETWANQTEADARVYQLGAPPPQTFEVISAQGSPVPSVGIYTNEYGAQLNPSAGSPTPVNGTQYVAVGWTMTGNDPVSGDATSFSMTLTNAATLTWLWNTNVNFTRTANAHGAITGDDSGYYSKGASVTVTAVPDGGYSFGGWTGEVPDGQEMDNPLTLTLDAARSVTANFAQDVGHYAVITLDGSLGEWTVQDVFYADEEIADGAPPSSTYSSVSVVNDNTHLYVGLKLKAPGSINSNWVHELYIDADMNPSTGFNAGWMSGGYDRLVQYGAGGTVYSIYSFSGGNQGAWSWDYLGAIGYSFNDDTIEWAIPRSQLGPGSIVRLEFHVSGGDVTTETWAHQGEANVKAYAFATENNCPAGIPPQIISVSDKTIDAGQTLSFEVRANDPGCVPPDLSIIGKPGAASFTLNPSGTNQVGSFGWTPGIGDVGTYLLRFTAEDDEGATDTFVMRVYVAAPGEPRNDNDVPESQENWAVQLTNIEIPPGGNVTAHWDAVTGILYDIYTSPGPFRDGMSWSRVVTRQEADGSSEETALSMSGRTNFVQVVPAGAAPTSNGVWGVIRPTVVGGMSMLSAPLRSDLAFNGQFGAELAESLPENTTVSIMHSGANPTWTILKLNGSKQWVLDSGTPQYTLDPGQAFFITNPGGTQTPAISGPVGNTGEQRLSLAVGFNLIGVSEGKNLAASGAFESAAPVGNYDDELADQVVVLNPNGSWRRLIRRPNGTWYDTANPNSNGNTTLTLSPGQAYYYIRRNSTTDLDF